MASCEIDEIWRYVDEDNIADRLSTRSYFDAHDFTDEEIGLASRAISRSRIEFVVTSLSAALEYRNKSDIELLDLIDGRGVIDVRELVSNKWIDDNIVSDAVKESGRYVCFEDFQLSNRQVRMGYEAVTALFHSLVPHFLSDDATRWSRAEKELRYQPYNQPWSNKWANTHSYFLDIEMLVPYSQEKVPLEYKIGGIGRKGRRLMRAVLFDEEEIEDLLASERARLD